MRLLFLFGLVLGLVLPGRAQEPVRNVRLRVINDSTQLEIRYDLLTRQPGDSVYVGIRSRVRGTLLILPEFVWGDIGKRVTIGSDRRIIWDAVANGYRLAEDIRATVFVKSRQVVVTVQSTPVDSSSLQTPVSQLAQTNLVQKRTDTARNHSKKRYIGPAWALVSAVAPGVGNIFVRERPKVGFRPLVTVGCYGLLVYGLMERQKSSDAYAVYEQQKNKTEAEPYYRTANGQHQRYYLATRTALVVAAADVVLTFIRGMHNQRSTNELRQQQGVTFRPGLQAGQPTAVMRYSF